MRRFIPALLLVLLCLAAVPALSPAMIPPAWECDLAEWYGWQNSWHNEQCWLAIMDHPGYDFDPNGW